VADVDDRGLLDPTAVEAAITPRTGAILAVHLTGVLAPMARLRAIADRHGLALIADAAHALGAMSGSISAGSLGDIEAFSIGATKQVAAGEGGCLTVRDSGLVPVARRWALQGHEPGSIDAVGPGMNLRLSELTAALALRQLESLAAQLDRRQWIHEQYAAATADLPLRLSGPKLGVLSAHKDQLVWLDDPADRGPLRRHLARAGIETRSYYEIAIPDLTAFSGRVASADRSRDLAARSFAIPIHARLTGDEVNRVTDGVREYFGDGHGLGR
jgi:dTDP-4-amino-4,6-dideoxygalactose transaminase